MLTPTSWSGCCYRFVLTIVVSAAISGSVAAQQRPLATEDPETIGAGRLLIEGGVDYAHDQHYPVSGLTGNLWRIPVLGVSVGISSIAEIQLDSGFYNRLSIKSRNEAPLSGGATSAGGLIATVLCLGGLQVVEVRVIAECHPFATWRTAQVGSPKADG